MICDWACILQELIRTPVHAPESPSSAGMSIHETPSPAELALDEVLDAAHMAIDETSSVAQVTTDKMLSCQGK